LTSTANGDMYIIRLNNVTSFLPEEIPSAAALLLYPNPANEMITIQWDSVLPGALVTVLDALGREVMRTTFTGAGGVLPVDGLADGNYVLNVLNGDGLYRSQRFTVQH
jgi:hypothetical protein